MNLSYVSAIEPPWWLVNIGLDNDFMPAGKKPSPEPMLTQTYVDILGPGWDFADDIFKSTIFLNLKIGVLFEISLKFVCQGLVNNKPVPIQIMAWHQTGRKLSEPMNA